MTTTNIKTAAVNGIKRVAENSLMGTALTAKGIASVFNAIEERSFNTAVSVRAGRKDISQEQAAVELSESYKHTLENIDSKYERLKGIFSRKQNSNVEEVPAKIWEPKIV